MNNVPTKVVNEVARLMVEMDPMAGHVSHLAGGTMAQDAATLMTINQTPGGSQHEIEDCPEYAEEELQLAKQFIEMIGNADRARELVDKAAECEECLGIVGDGEVEGDMIGVMASTMPDTPDMPNMAARYDPGQQT